MYKTMIVLTFMLMLYVAWQILGAKLEPYLKAFLRGDEMPYVERTGPNGFRDGEDLLGEIFWRGLLIFFGSLLLAAAWPFSVFLLAVFETVRNTQLRQQLAEMRQAPAKEPTPDAS